MSKVKVCVFCNKSPIGKNKEYVLPDWLIKLTGDVNRPINIKGLGKNPRTFNFRSFTFPACTKCNDGFSDLEAKAKKIVMRMINKLSLSSGEFEILMNWMDKVMIGIWLGTIMYSKNPLGIIPHYGIATRPRKDRMLIISITQEPSLRLTFSGFDDPLFHHIPCFFGLYVNGISLISISTDFLFSGELPLPNYTKVSESREGKVLAQLELPKTSTIQLPYIGKRFTVIAQINYLQRVDIKYFNKEQIKYFNRDLDSSKVLIIKKKKLIIYPSKTSTDWRPEPHKTREGLLSEQNSKFLRLRNWIAVKSLKNSINPFLNDIYGKLVNAKIVGTNF